jgi:hypothetical protein
MNLDPRMAAGMDLAAATAMVHRGRPRDLPV